MSEEKVELRLDTQDFKQLCEMKNALEEVNKALYNVSYHLMAIQGALNAKNNKRAIVLVDIVLIILMTFFIYKFFKS